MSIILSLTENETRVLALLACRQSIKYTAKCLGLSPRQVHYYLCNLRLKLNAPDQDELFNLISKHEDYEALVLMGQHLMVAYEMGSVQKRLALFQQE